MAFVSYGLNRGADQSPDAITVGTDNGGGGNDVTLCYDKTKALTHNDIIEITKAFIRRLEDGRNTDLPNI